LLNFTIYYIIYKNKHNVRRDNKLFTKYLKRKLVLKEANDFVLENPLELEYYLVESDENYKDEVEPGVKMKYGISVVKKINDECLEENSILNFCNCAGKVDSIINKLADNTVTPIGLKPVLDDLQKNY